MSRDSSNIVSKYLEDLRSSVMWGNCAGNTTRLDHLHHNRLINRELMVDSCISFFKIIDALNNVRDLIELPDEIRNIITDLTILLENSDWKETLNETLPDSIEDSMSTEDYEKLEELAEKILSTDSPSVFIGQPINEDEEDMDVYVETEGTVFSEALIEKIDSAIKIFWKKVHTSMQNAQNDSKSFAQFMTDTGSSMGTINNEVRHFHLWDGEDNTSVFGDTKRCWGMLRYGAVDLEQEINSLRDFSGDYETKAGIGFTVYGDPGWGKTILLRQHGYDLANALLNEEADEILPIEEQEVYIPVYLKGKVLIKHIESLSPYDWDIGRPMDDGSYETFLLSELEDLQNICINSMLESEKELDKEIVTSFIHEVFDKKRNILFLIDAYDEIPSREGRINLINFLHEQFRIHDNRCILTSRFTHREELEEFSEMISDIGGWGELKSLEIHFTDHECQYEMPTKLANAWGSDSGDIEYYVSERWQDYRDVLNTPLFVGLFCMLISEGHLHEMESSITERGLLETRVRKSRSSRKGERVKNHEKPVTMPHVVFLRKVIDFGLKENIQNRKEINDQINLEKLRKIVLYVAATHKILNLNSITVILDYIQKIHSIKLSSEELKIFKEDLGIMFVNSENDIEWTHPTLPEVALGMLISEDIDYSNYLKSMYGSIFGPRDVWWSECLILTLISNQNYSQYKQDIHPLIEISNMFPKMSHFSIRSTVKMFYPFFRKFEFTSINMDFENNSFQYEFECRRPEDRKTVSLLCDQYLGFIIANRPFPFPLQPFSRIIEDYSENNFFEQMLRHIKNGNIGKHILQVGRINIFAYCKYDTIKHFYDGDLARLGSVFLHSLRNKPYHTHGGNVSENINAYLVDIKNRELIFPIETLVDELIGDLLHQILNGGEELEPEYTRILTEYIQAGIVDIEQRKQVKFGSEWMASALEIQQLLITMDTHEAEVTNSDTALHSKMRNHLQRITQNSQAAGVSNLLINEYLKAIYRQIITFVSYGFYIEDSLSVLNQNDIIQALDEWGIKLNTHIPKLDENDLFSLRRKMRKNLREEVPSRPAEGFSIKEGLSLKEALIIGTPTWFVRILLKQCVGNLAYRRE